MINVFFKPPHYEYKQHRFKNLDHESLYRHEFALPVLAHSACADSASSE
jgi:hypothetical protein